jgi:hypothetical protein
MSGTQLPGLDSVYGHRNEYMAMLVIDELDS